MNHHSQRTQIPIQNHAVYIVTFLIFLLLAYVITIGGLLVLAFLLYKIPLSDSAVNIGIVVIYTLSTFLTAFICGKKLQKKKFLWGLLLGAAYFLILLIISLITNQSTVSLGSNALTAFLICAGSGMLGGMLA